MKKKLISMLLCVSMVAGVFAGCGSKEEAADTSADQAVEDTTDDAVVEEETADPLMEDEGKTITVAHQQGEYIYEKFYEMGDKFKELTGITVEWVEIASADWDTWLQAQFAAGTEPDVIWGFTDPTTGKDYFDQGKIVDLTEYYDQENVFNGTTWKDCFSEGGLDNTLSTDGNSNICTAMTYATVNLYYNKDIMEELGLGTEPPTTFTEMFEMMEVCLQDGNYIPMSVMNSMGWNLTWIEKNYLDAMFEGTGVIEALDIIVPNGYLDDSEILLGLKTGKISYDDPRFEEYFTLMKEFTKYWNEDYNTIGWEFEALFNENKVLFTFNGGWYPSQVDQNGYDVNYGTAQVPSVDDEYCEYGVAEALKWAEPTGEAALYISQKCADEGNLSAAVKFLQFMTDANTGAQMYIDAVKLGTCIEGVVLPEEMAALNDVEYGDHKESCLQKSFKFTSEISDKYWGMYTEYLDAASTESAADFIEDLKAELLPSLDEAIEEYTTYDVLSYVDQVQ